MSNARIIEIPATRQIRSGKNNTMRKMRVAAYCRVSTEEEEQQGSFETQKLYYTEKINSTSEWELAGIYADDGISGIHTKKRDGFNQMIQDCKKKENRPNPYKIHFALRPQHAGQHPICPNAESNRHCGDF